MYLGEFKNWNDVRKEYKTSTPEPEEVIVADYDREDYEGSSVVVYRNSDTYYVIYASHCSCYGLEDKFDPEEYTKELLIKYLLDCGPWNLEAYKKLLLVKLGHYEA